MSAEDFSRYIEYQMTLDELLSKERIADEMYDADIARFQANDDLVGLEEYKRYNVKMSVFESKKNSLLRKMEEIQQKYEYNKENVKIDVKKKAQYSRDSLTRILGRYEILGMPYALGGLSVEKINSMSDEEVISEYIEFRRRVNIERALREFRDKAEEISKLYSETKFKLVFGDLNDIDVTEAIKGMDAEVRSLNEEAKQIISEMDAFRLESQKDDFSMSVTDVLSTVKQFKDRLKELKQNQKDKYNARVEATNKLINELRGRTDLSPEVLEMMQRLQELPTCNISIGAWTDFKYLSQIDYNSLIATNKIIADIQNKIKDPKVEDGTLEADILWIEKSINELEAKIKDDLSDEEIKALREEIANIGNRINEFNLNLHGNKKERISQELFEEYEGRANDAQINLANLNSRLGKGTTYSNVFEELKAKLSELNKEVDAFVARVDSSFGKAKQEDAIVLGNDINKIIANLKYITDKVNEEYKNGKLDKNQYKELKKIISNIKKKFEEAKKKTKDPGMYIDVDIFAFLNGELTGIIEAIDALEKQIDSIPDKITDREVRKNIDAQFKAIEQDIKTLEEHLEKYKDEDPEKHQELVEKLNEQKDRLDKLGKKYREKCPLLVRVVKSAKSFYKKHKKAILIAAGLAAFALLANTVIIPAIMTGNMMIAYTSPALAGVANFMNTILGGLVGGHRVFGSNDWVLPLAGSVAPAMASTSLLKGLAMSGIGTAALVTPIIMAIRKLSVKGKLVEAKAKVKGWFGRNKTEENETEKPKKPKKRDKQSIDKFYTKYLKMVKDYLKSGMSLDEYCTENELSEGDKQMMQNLLDEYEKSKTNTEERKRGK